MRSLKQNIFSDCKQVSTWMCFNLVLFIMPCMVVLTIKSVNVTPPFVIIIIKATEQYFHVLPYMRVTANAKWPK